MAVCIHGFVSDQCLICQTLGPPERAGSSRRATTRTRRRSFDARQAGLGGSVEVVTGRTRSPARRATSHILLAAVVVVLAVVAFWVAAGVVVALLRLLEILAIAVVAGVLGYRLGRARGHRDR